MRKYIIWLIISVVVCLGFVFLVIGHNDESENDVLFLANSVGVGLSVNIVATLMIMVFLESRDKRVELLRAKRVAHRIAMEMRRFLRVVPGGEGLIDGTVSAHELRVRLKEAGEENMKAWRRELPNMYKRVEYLRDVFHGEISEGIMVKLDRLLEHDMKYVTEGAKELPISDVAAVVGVLLRDYGVEIFR